jgi:hypothetical protein
MKLKRVEAARYFAEQLLAITSKAAEVAVAQEE